MSNTLSDVLAYGPAIAHDADADLLLTVNGAYFNLWAGDGEGRYTAVEVYDRGSRVDDETWRGFVAVWTRGEEMLAEMLDGSRCPACGDVIDYCQGHGEMGDPDGHVILAAHDDGEHGQCHPEGCEEVS